MVLHAGQLLGLFDIVYRLLVVVVVSHMSLIRVLVWVGSAV